MVFRFLRLTTGDVPSLSEYVADRYRAIIRVTKFLVDFFLAPRSTEANTRDHVAIAFAKRQLFATEIRDNDRWKNQ